MAKILLREKEEQWLWNFTPIALTESRLINGIGLSKTRREEHKGTVPDLRTERSSVVESGLSPARRNAAQFAAEFGAGSGDIRLGCGMICIQCDLY